MNQPNRTKFIAEVSSNHGGDMSVAKEFIRQASDAGLDYVKFQSSRYEDLVDKNDAQVSWIKKTELSDDDHFILIEECKKHGIRFLTTCFSISRVKFLSSLGMDEIKVASPDLLSFVMIEKLAGSFKHLIISTGMHTRREIKKAIDFLLKNKINATLLHAVSLYPTPLEKVFMNKFLWLKENYPFVGYSNHTPAPEPIQFAVDNGASIIETHVKLGEDGPGRVTPWDMMIRDVKKKADYSRVLGTMTGRAEWMEDADFLFPEEVASRKRFINRWGDNNAVEYKRA